MIYKKKIKSSGKFFIVKRFLWLDLLEEVFFTRLIYFCFFILQQKK